MLFTRSLYSCLLLSNNTNHFILSILSCAPFSHRATRSPLHLSNTIPDPRSDWSTVQHRRRLATRTLDMTSSRAAPRSIRILVLGNAAAGAEKQALALGARLQERLRRHPAAVSVERASDDVRCVRVPLHSESIARRLPPLLHVAIARLRGDAFFGYDLAETHKKQLLPQRGKGSSDAATAKHRPLNVVIGCGRTTVALCATLKLMAESKSDVFNIQIQHPRVPLAWFDAVVAPRHDFPTRSTARSLLPKQLHLTTGTVCDIKSDVLRAHAEEWRHELAKHCTEARRHHVAWLIGGPCRGFAFTAEDAEQMASEFVDVMAHKELNPEDEVSIFVTFSRRTPTNVQ